MIRFSPRVFVFLLLGFTGLSSAEVGAPVVPLSPALSPDGENVVFAWRGDLWLVGIGGGQARRLTTHPSDDADPRVSPDGRTLYFTSFREGPRHLFSMPIEGGAITRHSHHSEGLRLETLSPDGGEAIVRAARDSPDYEGRRLFSIPLDHPDQGERLLFDCDARSASLHPDGRLLFCRNGESIHRKGYRGDDASSIWLRDAEGGFRKLIQEEAGARSPVWHPSGRFFYYISDRDGAWNIWRRSLENNRDTRLTGFRDDGVLDMTLSADGKRMVFTRGFSLWSWNPEGKDKPAEIPVTAYAEAMTPDEEVRESRAASEADFSASGLEIVFVADGALFTMDTVLKEPNRISRDASAWESPKFTAGAAAILAIEDSGVARRLMRVERAGADPDYWWKHREFKTTVLAGDDQPVAAFKLFPDGKSVAYVDITGGLHVLPVSGPGVAKRLYQGWEPYDFDISPDGVWIAVAPQNADFNRDIFILPVDGSREPYNVTRHPGREGSPRWSPDGRLLAFIGERVTDRTRVHIVHLSAADHLRTNGDLQRALAEETMKKDPAYEPDEDETGGAPARTPPETPAGGAGTRAEGNAPSVQTPKAVGIAIDFEGLHERVIPLDTGDLVPNNLAWSSDGKAVLYQETNGADAVVRRIEPLRGAKPTVHASFRGIPVRMVSPDTGYWIVDGAPAALQKGKLTRYPFVTRFPRSRGQHLALGFNMAWRIIRDQFYDPALNGLDWEKIRLKYLPHAASAGTFADYALVFERMFGELNASHVSFVPAAWPSLPPAPAARLSVTRHTGLRFRTDGESGRVEVAQVLPGSPAALAEPPIPVGAELLFVGETKVEPRACLARLFNGPPDDEVRLVLDPKGGEPREYRLRPISFETARALGRAEAVRELRRRIDRQTGGKVGYVRIARMDKENFEEFQRELFAEGEGRGGLIIDIRNNRGGFIADHLLTILTQPKHSFTIPRHGGIGHAGERTIYAVWSKPVTVLINQNSYSNAEVFAHAVQSTGRGKLVGLPTGGGVISTRRKPLLDLGTLSIPFRGWFHPVTGRDLELGPARPDKRVEISPADVLAGRDPQLDAAIGILLGEIRAAKSMEPAPVYRHEAMRGEKGKKNPPSR